MPSSSAILMRDLRFTYRHAASPALDGVDLEVAPGEIVVVLGASGAGKSTLCSAISGLVPHFLWGEMAGEVHIFGVETASRTVSQIAEEVGLLFQEFESQLFCTSVELEVAFGPENLEVPTPEIRRRVTAALAAVGLAGMERRDPATLSGGQKQRLALAAVLALQPRVLVLDEPTTDLDPAGRAELFALVRRLREEQGVAVVIAEHETEAALAADRVVLLDRGCVVGDGPPEEVLTRLDRLEERPSEDLGSEVGAPAVVRLLARLGEPICLDVDAAATRLRDRGYRIDPETAVALSSRDEALVASYGSALFELDGLEYRYPDGTPALAGVDLTIREGELVALVGANGSGKTTLARHLVGLLRPTGGGVRVASLPTDDRRPTTADRRGGSPPDPPIMGGEREGRPTPPIIGGSGGRVQGSGALSPPRRSAVGGRQSSSVGYVFQNPDHQLFAETVADEVAFGPRNHGVAESEVQRCVEEALAAVGLAGREREDPFSMTKGERQRVAVASVLATRPRALILDEPTTGLDARERRSMMELVRRLNQDGHTILCITHHLEIVAEYAHRVVVLSQGRLFLDGPTREVLAREQELADAGLRAPDLVQLGSRLGFPFLTVEEGVSLLGGVAVR